jgi:hypothetical protein
VAPFRRNRRMSPMAMELSNKCIAELLEKEFIQLSVSPFGAPIIVVEKPNNRGFRVVCDWQLHKSSPLKKQIHIHSRVLMRHLISSESQGFLLAGPQLKLLPDSHI